MMVAKHNGGHLIVLAAGGTGGHVFPAEALAQELLAQGHRLVLMTDARGAAYRGTLGQLETVRIRAGALAGRGLFSRVAAIADLGVGFVQARRHLAALQPAAVVGFGGYAAAPTVLAAVNLGLITVIHEQNAVLGRANRMLAGRVRQVCTSFDLVGAPPPKAAVTRTGMPVRPVVAAVRAMPYAAPEADGPFRVLVLGGSQGARVFSDVIPAAIAKLPRGLARRIDISQQCRPEDLERVEAAYAPLGLRTTLKSFFDDVPDRLAQAHLLIARSGASTVAEVAIAGRPSLLVPYPFAADDHQTANARAISASGGAWMIPQPAFTPEAVAARLTELMSTPQMLSAAASAAAAFSIPDAAGRLAGVITSLTRGENGARHEAAAVSATLRPPVTPGAV